tara:strand:- start:670 stop:822 length:153 start_codon:yes stop_codon:yes gene_type:complete
MTLVPHSKLKIENAGQSQVLSQRERAGERENSFHEKGTQDEISFKIIKPT